MQKKQDRFGIIFPFYPNILLNSTNQLMISLVSIGFWQNDRWLINKRKSKENFSQVESIYKNCGGVNLIKHSSSKRDLKSISC